MKSLEELANVNAAIQSEVFSRLILEGAQESRKLSGIIAATTENLSAGVGSTVKVTYFPSRVAQGPIDIAESLTPSESTMKSFTITIAQYGDYDFLDGFSLYQAGNDVKVALLSSMSNGFGYKFDDIVYNEIATAVTGNVIDTLSVDTVSGTANFTGDDLLNAIVDLKAMMLAGGTEYGSPTITTSPSMPTHVIIPPSMEALLLKTATTGDPKRALVVAEDGRVVRIAGLDVIITAHMPEPTGYDDLVAILVDKSRAVGEAFGMKPTFEEERVPLSNTYREIAWAYYGASELDVDGIGHIKTTAT